MLKLKVLIMPANILAAGPEVGGEAVGLICTFLSLLTFRLSISGPDSSCQLEDIVQISFVMVPSIITPERI